MLHDGRVQHSPRQPLQKKGLRSILLVEDSPDIAASFVKTLQLLRSDLQISAVATGEEALKGVLSHRPDVVITDIKLPDLPGYELARQVRLAFPEIKLISMTAFGTYDTLSRIVEAGCEAYLEKPFSFEMLNYYLNLVLDEEGPHYELPLRDLLLYYTNKQASIVLHITIHEQRAVVYIDHGIITHVKFHSLEGAEALAALLVAPRPQIFTCRPREATSNALRERCSVNLSYRELEELEALNTQPQLLQALRKEVPLFLDAHDSMITGPITDCSQVFRSGEPKRTAVKPKAAAKPKSIPGGLSPRYRFISGLN